MRSMFQVDLLTRYQSFRHQPPTVAKLAKANALSVGGWCFFSLTIAALLWWLEVQLIAAGILGFVAATLFHAFTSYFRTTNVWPVVDQITDWDAVERLAGHRSGPNSSFKPNPLRGSA